MTIMYQKMQKDLQKLINDKIEEQAGQQKEIRKLKEEISQKTKEKEEMLESREADIRSLK